MNSLIPSEKQYDSHFAHRCVGCEALFSKVVPVAGDCDEGSLCQECFDAKLRDEAHESEPYRVGDPHPNSPGVLARKLLEA